MSKLGAWYQRNLCRLLACNLDQYGPVCRRCGAYVYDSDFLQLGYIDPARRAIGRVLALRSRVSRRCDHCRKRMWFTREICCSEKCRGEWVPF